MSEARTDTLTASQTVELTRGQRLALTCASLLSLASGLGLLYSAVELERPHLGPPAPTETPEPQEQPTEPSLTNQQASDVLGAATHRSLIRQAPIDVLVGRCIRVDMETPAGSPASLVILNPVVAGVEQIPKDRLRVLGGVTPNRLPDRDGDLKHSVYPIVQAGGELQLGELGVIAGSTHPHPDTVVLSREHPQRLRSNNDLLEATDASLGGIVHLAANIAGDGPATQFPPGHILYFEDESGQRADDYCITP